MLRYIVRRLLMMIPVLIGATLIVFAIMDSSPGDPALSKVGVEASPEQVEEMRESMGLNDPFFIRYGRFLLGLLLHPVICGPAVCNGGGHTGGDHIRPTTIYHLR